MLTRILVVLAVVCCGSTVPVPGASTDIPAQATGNLLRNGSFEGGKRYWFQAEDTTLVRGDAADGEYSLRIEKGMIQSAAFELEPGKPVTISFSVKADAPATMGWQCTPCGREIGAKLGLTWGLRGRHPIPIGTAWQRVSVSFTPNAPQDGFWPRPTYMLQIGDADKPLLLDAVTVAYGQGADAYVPRREIEVQVDCPDLKGYKDPSANLLERGQAITLAGFASNPSLKPRDVTLRWQLFDYEGERPVSPAVEKTVTLLPGKVVSESVPVRLTASGLVLARFSAVADGKVLDSSDLPLTSLPYPKAATKPDWRERFGGSLWGPHVSLQHQKIGFAWTRWRPHMTWADHQPDGPDAWKWFDKELDELASFGISTHAVLYGKPKWAFDEGQQLPRDMQWPAKDSRWDDLKPQCGWDRFITEAVTHYHGRSLIYEIENEPEFDGWDNKKDLYAKFTIRTARLIKQTDPQAKVMVDNVYGIPSGLNRTLLEQGAAQYLDVISWHDYHEGWLSDAVAIKRMRLNLDDLGGKRIEIWFNEGWAYTNTAVDEPALALTNLTAAQSTNAMICSVSEMTAAGQEKTILFHTGYEEHGMSFWDYCGPGTMLWDFYGYPLPLVPAWNVLTHHIGLSDRTGIVRPPGANFCIFQDLRNGRGVMVAYADRDAPADVTVTLPDFGAPLAAEDAMGNASPAPKALILPRNGRPVFLYSAAKISGQVFLEKLAPLDRKNASFVSTGGAGGPSWQLPPTWEGTQKDSTAGNPAMADGKPVWRLDQVWLPDPLRSGDYRPLAWRDGWWVALQDSFGGQPKAEMKDSGLRMEFRGAHGQPQAPRQCGLVFIAPQAGTYHVTGTAELKLWDGSIQVRLQVLHKAKDRVVEVAAVPLVPNERVSLGGVQSTLAAGDELVLLPSPGGPFVGGDVTLREVRISLGDGGTPASVPIYRLPAAWEGSQVGTAQGNPIAAGGKPVWRLDQVWPDKPIFTENYTPLSWSGTEWQPTQYVFGGQPAVSIANGSVNFAVRGSWTGNEGQRIAGLIFIAPGSGIYTVRGTARSQPWEGSAPVFRLAVIKKDTQRAAELRVLELPRDGSRVPFELKIDLSAGNELVFIPLMPDWHNATHTTIEGLTIAEER